MLQVNGLTSAQCACATYICVLTPWKTDAANKQPNKCRGRLCPWQGKSMLQVSSHCHLCYSSVQANILNVNSLTSEQHAADRQLKGVHSREGSKHGGGSRACDRIN